MKDEKETLRKTADSIHVMEKFDPAILADGPILGQAANVALLCVAYQRIIQDTLGIHLAGI